MIIDECILDNVKSLKVLHFPQEELSGTHRLQQGLTHIVLLPFDIVFGLKMILAQHILDCELLMRFVRDLTGTSHILP